MKLKIATIFFLFLSVSIFSQKTIEASDIMKDIKAGKSISYQNAKIVGTLDFTFMEDASDKLPKRKKSFWSGNGNSSNDVKNKIDVDISFVNCTFKDDVLAYIPNNDSGYTFTADFEKRAIFKNCNFERKAMFKYSNFERESDFSGSNFEDDSTFKFAKFDNNISFENTKFTETATFKYTEFKRNVSFSNAVFEDEAIFKYTKFKDGVSFNSTNFEEDLDIKYMEVSGSFDINKMKVGFDIDSKYTTINGRNFNKYLLEAKN